MSRSNKEEREKNLGTGLLEGARKGMVGRRSRLDELEAEANGEPAPKKTKTKGDK